MVLLPICDSGKVCLPISKGMTDRERMGGSPRPLVSLSEPPQGELKEESGNHLSKENTSYPQAGGEIDIILKHSVVMKE